MYGQPISFSAHRTRIQEPEFINLESLENQPLPPNAQPSYSTFSALPRRRDSRFLEDCASIYPLPLTIGLGLSIQTLHQIIALRNPAGTIFHHIYRYSSVIDRPWFALFIFINVLIIFFLVTCGLVVVAGAIAEKKRNRFCRATMVLIGSWWLCGPLMLFILTCVTSQPLPVMRTEVAKYCSQQTKPPMMSALVVSHQPSEGVREIWITNRQGREISLWGITPINPRKGYTVKVNSMPDSNKWTRDTGRVWELVVSISAVTRTLDESVWQLIHIRLNTNRIPLRTLTMIL